MKHFLLVCLLCSIAGLSQAQKIKWYSFEEGVAKAKEENKKVFIDVYTDWCGYCVKMDKTTFSNSEVAEYMNKHFIPIKLDAETKDTINFKGYQFINPQNSGRRSNNTLAYALIGKRLSFPSFVFLEEEKLEKIDVLKGYVPKDRFLSILEFVGSDAYKNTTFKEYQKETQKK